MINAKDFIDIYNKTNKWKHDINYSVFPLIYEVTEDCGGMYTCEPYKTKLLEVWRFSNIKVSKLSAKAIIEIFEEYVANNDFVGADLAKKYLRAGSTKRAVPEECKKYFKSAYKKVEKNLNYSLLRKTFIERKKIESKKNEKR